ncbi:MAG: CoA transferase, partial [Chromatiales bacterium]|nr:CoA transferase [Chromatiales bacterium]
VMIEAFRPGVVSRLGVGYDQVKERAPGIVYCSISAFGQDGPYVKKPAHDLASHAYAGILSVNLGPDNKPAMPGLQSADMLSAMMSLSGILMALLRKEKTGKGDYIDISMMDSLMACMPNNLGPVFAEQRAPTPKDERSWGGNAMFSIYETKEGRHLVLGGAEIHFAENVLNKLGRPDLIPLCQPPPGPNQDPVREFFAKTFLTKTLPEWMEWFEDVDASAAPVNTLREAFNDPHAQAREMVVKDHRGWEHVGIPIKFRAEPGAQSFALPALGEHTDELLSSLGYSEADIDAARAAGAFRR